MSGLAINTFGCGPFFPNNLLDDGDHAVLQAPIADFQSELALMKIKPAGPRAVSLADGQTYPGQSSAAEMSDLAAALKQAKVSNELATVIMKSHLAERMKLNAYLKQRDEWSSFSPGFFTDTNGFYRALPNTNPPPAFPDIAITPGLPLEFADYFEGAIAWRMTNELDASFAWQRVLDLPAPERHFKSVWAAYMLGTEAANVTNHLQDDEALDYFEQVRELTRSGFADSLGLATASIGQEARIWLERGQYERAIELYLQQFAAGDQSAINSLRFAAARAISETNAATALLKTLALNPQTRRVITAYLISRHPYNDRSQATNDPDAKNFFDGMDKWLAAVDAARVKDVESAEEIALAAYQADDMNAAQRWINHARNSVVAQWLQAKLFLRAGKVDEAAKILGRVSREFPKEMPQTNAPVGFAQCLFVDINPVWNDCLAAGPQSLGELGVLHLKRREYAEALDALLRSGHWMDAAYVAERVLTTEELRTYVDRNWPAVGPEQEARETSHLADGNWGIENTRESIRYLLARRIARETGARSALAYYPTNLAGPYEMFLNELHTGRNERLENDERAKNLYAAAILARTNGMELFGTELEPDWEIYGGAYQFGLTWEERAANPAEAKINLATTNEIERASSRETEPDRRFHYRWQAAELAWEAAQLMPDNTDDLARLLCTAGTWVKDCDPLGADKFYKALVRRCRQTALGAEADALRWFPVQPINGAPPRLDTIEITVQLTNALDSVGGKTYSREYPVPGRLYSVHEDEDVYVISRAVRRLGGAMNAEDLLQANPGLKRGPIPEGTLVMIPETSNSTR